MAKNRNVSWLLLAVFLWTTAFGMTTPPAYAGSKSTDINGHWAQSQIENLTAQNIFSGYPDGTFKPDKTITRAEFATVLVKAFKLEIKTGKVFNDTANHWAKDYIATVNAFGIANGYNNAIFGPNDAISREQMAVMIVKATGLETLATGKVFSDDSKISAWAKNAVSIASGNNLISGYPDNTFKPQGSTTRAEAAIVINNAIVINKATTFDKAGTYGPATGTNTIEGDVVISVPGVILQNTTITGNLLLAEEIGDGDITLKNVTVKGKTTVKGGGHSVVLDNCTLPNITVSKDGVRIVASGSTTVSEVTLESGATLEEVNTTGLGFETVTISPVVPANASISLSGSFDTVNVNAADVSVAVESGTVGTLTVAENASGSTINVATQATVTTLALNAATQVTGQGTITKALVNTSGTTMEKAAANLTLATGITTTVNNKTVTQSTSSTPNSSHSGGNSTVAVSAIGVTSGTAKVGVVLTAGALTPVAATASYQWQICDTVGGTYADIAGAIASTYTPVPGDVNKFIKVVATGTGNYYGTVTSAATGAVAVAPVNLGTAGDYVILAKEGISTVPTSAITGNIGVSPAAASYITEFALVADTTNVFSTSTQVIGKVYAADYAPPTPSNLTTAVSDMEAAYTDAAGRAADVTELGTGEIGGLTIEPGVYKWGTDVLISTDVTLDGGATDVWIFQIAKGITQANGTSIILKGGALAKNIFWQAAETVAIGTTAHFEGIILGQTNITLNTGASINGRLLAQTAVTLIANIVVAP